MSMESKSTPIAYSIQVGDTVEVKKEYLGSYLKRHPNAFAVLRITDAEEGRWKLHLYCPRTGSYHAVRGNDEVEKIDPVPFEFDNEALSSTLLSRVLREEVIYDDLKSGFEGMLIKESDFSGDI